MLEREADPPVPMPSTSHPDPVLPPQALGHHPRTPGMLPRLSTATERPADLASSASFLLTHCRPSLPSSACLFPGKALLSPLTPRLMPSASLPQCSSAQGFWNPSNWILCPGLQEIQNSYTFKANKTKATRLYSSVPAVSFCSCYTLGREFGLPPIWVHILILLLILSATLGK